MPSKDKFIEEIRQSFTFKGEYIILGGAIYQQQPVKDLQIKIPLKTLNRHGLIAGATGTGKTKTLQVIAERLSAKSVPVLLMDIKGDLSGLAVPGTDNSKIEERHKNIGELYTPRAFPVDLLTISEQSGVRLRATVSEFGPVLFSKILELNDTQSGIVSLIFKYCDDNQLPLLDLKDFKKVLQYVTNEGKDEIESEYGKISTASTGTILRKIIELEQQQADLFFGEKSFEVADLLRINEEGYGMISILRLNDLQEKPKLFSTFMLSLLAEIYSSFPEEGDLDQPKLAIFIDEAHLIFNEASKALLDQIETIIKLIRSKGVGIFFCTQNPTDIPASILSQLGLKIQHALRAFTANDRKMIKLTAENYPISEYYKTDELLTSLGIGEAAVSALDEKGRPTALAATLLCAPKSRMDILTTQEIENVISKSTILKKYSETIDRESAYELLNAKLASATISDTQNKVPSSNKRQPKSTVEKMIDSPLARQVGRTVARELTRGILGVLGLGGSVRKGKSLF
jgi:DNA double-strand break repair helicase HerA and related ATPase